MIRRKKSEFLSLIERQSLLDWNRKIFYFRFMNDRRSFGDNIKNLETVREVRKALEIFNTWTEKLEKAKRNLEDSSIFSPSFKWTSWELCIEAINFSLGYVWSNTMDGVILIWSNVITPILDLYQHLCGCTSISHFLSKLSTKIVYKVSVNDQSKVFSIFYQSCSFTVFHSSAVSSKPQQQTHPYVWDVLAKESLHKVSMNSCDVI